MPGVPQNVGDHREVDLQLIKALEENSDIGVRNAIENCANPNITIDFEGDEVSALYYAAHKSEVDTALLLILYGADINFKHPIRNDTALDIAIHLSDLPIIRVLLARGVRPNFKSMLLKFNAWQEYPRVVSLLLKHNVHKDQPLDFSIGLLEMLLRRAVSSVTPFSEEQDTAIVPHHKPIYCLSCVIDTVCS